jgi:membrane associated rhomboid family serine protease
MVLPLGDNARTQIVPIATYVLIATNIVAFLYEQEQPEPFRVAYAATPYEITHRVDLDRPFELPLPGDENPADLPGRVDLQARVIPQAPVPFPVWLTLLTSMFLHGSWLHLAGNMLFLWIFGDNVEEALGTVRYILAYLACGLAGSLAQIAMDPDSLIPTLGASGAIAGIMGMYVVWFPFHRVRVLLFQFITEVPALLVIGLWIGLQVWAGLGSIGRLGQVGGVAYMAHIGGAATGIGLGLLYRDLARGRYAVPPWPAEYAGRPPG